MQIFFRNCTHILTRTQGKKFEDMFLVKIASQGTSLSTLLSITVRDLMSMNKRAKPSMLRSRQVDLSTRILRKP